MSNSSSPTHRAVLIEAGDLPAGIAMPENGAYRFIAVDARFRLLDGSRFKRPAQAELAARNLLAAQGTGFQSPRDRAYRAA